MESIATNELNVTADLLQKGWIEKTLKELIVLRNGYAFSSAYYSENGPILITPGNFSLKGGLIFNESNTIRYSGQYDTQMVFEQGDLLIVMTDLTPDCNLLGKPGIVITQEKVLHNQRIGKIVIRGNAINKSFLYWYFLSDFFSRRMKSTATGSTVRHTSVGSIYNSTIRFPKEEAEQTAIATALSDMDAYIRSLEKLIEKKRLIKKGVMQELLSPVGKDGKMKEGWVVRRLGEVLKIRHGRSQQNVLAEDGDYPILATGGEIGRASNYIYNKPSVLIGRKGTIDKPQYRDAPFWCVDTLFYSEINDDHDAKFIFYMFNLIDWYALNEASGVPSLNASTIQSVVRYFPDSIDAEKEIAQRISEIDFEIDILSGQLEKYQDVKIGMMQQLLTGKIRLA